MRLTISLVVASLLGILAPPAQTQPEPAVAQEFLRGRMFQIAIMEASNFTASGLPVYGRLDAGETERVEQTLSAGHCYVWVAVGETGMLNLNMQLLVEGRVVATEDTLDDWPIAHYCSPDDVAATVLLSAQAGSGGFGFNSYSRFVGGDDAIEIHLNLLGSLYAPQSAPVGPITRAELSFETPLSFSVPLDGSGCFTVVGTATGGVRGLNFVLQDASGNWVGADYGPGPYALVGVCTEQSGNYILGVTSLEGSGSFGWRVFEEPMFDIPQEKHAATNVGR